MCSRNVSSARRSEHANHRVSPSGSGVVQRIAVQVSFKYEYSDAPGHGGRGRRRGAPGPAAETGNGLATMDDYRGHRYRYYRGGPVLLVEFASSAPGHSHPPLLYQL